MLVKKEEMQPVMVVEACVCDRCKKRLTPASDVGEFQEMLHYRDVGGYWSIFGDGVEISCDLCQECIKEVLGPYLRFRQVGPQI